ncbi:hypothetical protein ACR8AL_09410 [Clavibacter sepedonicus]|nr:MULTISPECIES: hypothetical protein [Clavibacter]MBD5382667.1 hypothetical protein [Clavibacter sp.]UUK67260.1 hypothetical protein LRE50_16000 [Clavibacter sepedonicus]
MNVASERDPQKLRQYLRDPHENVRAAAILNPRTPHDAVRALLSRKPGRAVRAALVLHPVLTDAERASLLRSEDSETRSVRIAILAAMARFSQSPAELAELAKHPATPVLLRVASNRHTSRETRADLRHWSSPARIRASLPRLSPSTARHADPDRLGILRQVVEYDRAENRARAHPARLVAHLDRAL